MAVNFNPAIVNNGLVFAYDMGNTKKSWFGAPTTNLAKNSDESIDWSIGNLTGAVSRSTVTTNEVYRITSTTAGAFRFYFNLSKLVNGQAYTMSFRYRFISQNASQSFYLTDWNDTAIITTTTDLGDGIVYHTGTGSRATYDSTYRFMDGYISASTIVEIWDLQLEQSSIATPYTKYQRTNSQSLRDLTGDANLNCNNLTYDSAGEFSFGASGQRIVSNISTFGTNATWDSWIYCTNGTASTYNMFMGRYLPYFSFYGGNRLYFSNNIGGSQRTIQTSANLTTNTWYHASFTTDYDGVNTTMKIYTNGIETATGTFSGAQYDSYPYVFTVGDGYDANWYRFNGQVASVKIYNRTLSSLEIMQNFSALRARFGV